MRSQSRSNLYEQKKADIRHVVEAGVSLLGSLEQQVAKGEMTREQAQAEARKLLSASRHEKNEYIFALDFDHRMTVHPTKPERVGKSLIDEKDPSGKYYIRDFVSVAKAGGGTQSLAASLGRLLRAADDTNTSSQSVVSSASGLSDQATSLKREVAEFVARMQAA